MMKQISEEAIKQSIVDELKMAGIKKSLDGEPINKLNYLQGIRVLKKERDARISAESYMKVCCDSEALREKVGELEKARKGVSVKAYMEKTLRIKELEAGILNISMSESIEDIWNIAKALQEQKEIK